MTYSTLLIKFTESNAMYICSADSVP